MRFRLDTYQGRCAANGDPKSNRLDPSPVRPYGAWFKSVFGVDRQPEQVQVTYNCLFYISTADILRLPRKTYARLRETVSHHSAPEAVHYVERTWYYMWGAFPRVVNVFIASPPRSLQSTLWVPGEGQERTAIELWESHNPGWEFRQTHESCETFADGSKGLWLDGTSTAWVLSHALASKRPPVFAPEMFTLKHATAVFTHTVRPWETPSVW